MTDANSFNCFKCGNERIATGIMCPFCIEKMCNEVRRDTLKEVHNFIWNKTGVRQIVDENKIPKRKNHSREDILMMMAWYHLGILEKLEKGFDIKTLYKGDKIEYIESNKKELEVEK